MSRLVSLDAFRGFLMMMIIGLDAFFWELGRWIYGGPNWLSSAFSHREWFGLSFYDCIFPAFLFVAGLSFPFSYARQLEKGLTKSRIHLKIFRRAAILVALGWVVNGVFQVGFGELRYGSVLGKIGLGWMFAALYFIHFRRAARILICAALVGGFALLLNLFVAPDFPNASPFSVEGNIIGWLERQTMPGTLICGATIDGVSYPSLFDPSGLYMSFFAAATAMLGMFAGEIIRAERFSGNRRTLHLLVLAAGLLLAGGAMALVVPVSKKLWSPSFLLLVGGGSTALFALFYWVADVRMCRWWTPFFVVVGLNSITIYVLNHIVNFDGISKFFLGGVIAGLSPSGQACLLGAGHFAACWFVTWFLYRQKFFLKV